MEQKVKFRDRQELQSADLVNAQDFVQEAIDHVVKDAIEGGKGYVGFAVTKTGAAEVTVDPGRLFSGGPVYQRPDSVVLDLSGLTPLVTKKRVAVVTIGQTVDTDNQPRDFLIDADTGQTEPNTVAMESLRRAEVQTVGGQEAADPAYPTTDATLLVIAYILMDTTGVVSIEQVEDNKLNNLHDVEGRTTDLETWRQLTGARIDTLGTDLASLARRLDSFALDTALQTLSLMVKEIYDKLNKPAAYLYHAIQKFQDLTDANTGSPGYAAVVSQGLRFPTAATTTQTVALLNPNDPNVINYSDLLLPTHRHVLRMDCKGYHREHRAGLHTFHAHDLIILAMSRHRLRYGPTYVKFNADWLLREVGDALKTALHRNDGTWNALTFNEFINNVTDTQARAFLRNLYQDGCWKDFIDDVYWANIQTTVSVSAYHGAQVINVSQDGWLTKVGLFFTRLAATGDVDVIVCEADASGKPMIDRVVSRTTVLRADLKVGTGSGGAGLPSIVETVVPITPALLKAGKKYAVIQACKGDHWWAISDTDYPLLNGMFWVWQDGIWSQQTSVMKIRLYFAQWDTIRQVVDLAPLQLAGGIRSIDLLGEIATPGNSALDFEVQVSGVWKKIDNDLDLSSLPAVLPFRAVFLGTTDIMSAKRLTTVKAILSREALALKYVSNTRTLTGTASKVVIKARVAGYDEPNHDLSCVLKTNGGVTTETADTTVDETLADGQMDRIFTFNIVADDDYRYELTGAIASMESHYVVSQVEETATA